jgi:arsenite oxidase small subunit
MTVHYEWAGDPSTARPTTSQVLRQFGERGAGLKKLPAFRLKNYRKRRIRGLHLVGKRTKSTAIRRLLAVMMMRYLYEMKTQATSDACAPDPAPEVPASPGVLNRRELLKLGGSGAAASALLATGLSQATSARGESGTGAEPPSYPVQVVARVRELTADKPLLFTYPDAASPCALLKTGRPVPGGIGPGKDIVAYSVLCTHRGCPVNYDAAARTFKCPCHFSIFDPERSGQQVCGQATVNLPRIVLDYDTKGDQVAAVSVDGLIYGRRRNLL